MFLHGHYKQIDCICYIFDATFDPVYMYKHGSDLSCYLHLLFFFQWLEVVSTPKACIACIPSKILLWCQFTLRHCNYHQTENLLQSEKWNDTRYYIEIFWSSKNHNRRQLWGGGGGPQPLFSPTEDILWKIT